MSNDVLTVYQAHPINGEYMGPVDAMVDPLEPHRWLIPAMAFTEEPPVAAKGFAVVHVPGGDQVWTQTPDLRGVVYSKATGQPLQWEALGPLPDDLTTTARPGEFYVWNGSEWQFDESLQREALVGRAETELAVRMSNAAAKMAPLQDAEVLQDITPVEASELAAWRRYRVALNRIQAQPGYPSSIDWPSEPTE